MGILNTSTIGALNAQNDISNMGNINAVGVVLSGTWSGTVTFQGSMDGSRFDNILALSVTSGLYTGTATANGAFVVNVSSFLTLRIKMTSYTSGTATCEVYTASSNVFNNSLVNIVGNTDATRIGNVGDRLKVDSSFSSSPRVSPSYIGTKVKFDDMNVANGGVARDTAITSTTVYTQLYSYTGNGHLFAFTVSFEGNLIGADPFNIKLEIDGVTCWEIDTTDLGTSTFWNVTNVGDEATMGLSLNGNTMRFSQKDAGLRYESSLKIYIKKSAGGSKRFRGGMVYLTKE